LAQRALPRNEVPVRFSRVRVSRCDATFLLYDVSRND
jgi:hypothetical protein